MKPSIFLVIKAVISLAFGLAFAAIPGIVGPLYGIQLDPTGVLMARWFGALLIGIGIICIFAGKATGTKLQQDVILSLFIADILGSVVAVVGQLSGLMNTLGWTIVAIWIILALGLGYLRFIWKAPTQ